MNIQRLACVLALLATFSASPAHAQSPSFPDPLERLSPATAPSRLFGEHLIYIDQPNGRADIGVEDLRVKVRGGSIAIQRRWDGSQWQIAPNWANLQFETARSTIAQRPLSSRKEDRRPSAPTVFGGTVVPGACPKANCEPVSQMPAGDFGDELTRIHRIAHEYLADDSGHSFISILNRRSLIQPIWAPHTPPLIEGGRIQMNEQGFAAQELIGWQWIDRTGPWIQYSRDGRIQSYGPKRNQTTATFKYQPIPNGQGATRITEIQDDSGRAVITFTYDGLGRISQIADVPRAETDPAWSKPRIVSYTYDTHGTLASATDVLGHRSDYAYDPTGRLVTLTEAADSDSPRVQRFEYGPTHRLSRHIHPDGSQTDYSYDYDALRRTFYIKTEHPLSAATDPPSRQTEERWIYAPEGRLIRSQLNGYPRFQLKRPQYLNGQEVHVDERGQRTLIKRDQEDQITEIKWPDYGVQKTTYSSNYLVPTQHIDERGTVTTTTYDNHGNPLERIQAKDKPEAITTTWTWDAHNQMLSQTVQGVQVTLPDGTSYSAPDASIRYEYDDWGNPTEVTDALGHVSQSTYNRQGLLTERTDAKGHTTTYNYNAKGQLIRITDPLGHSIVHRYNALGQRVQTTDARGHSWTYAYDQNGRLIKTTDPQGHGGQAIYDPTGLLTEQRDANGSLTQKLQYDSNHRPKVITQANGSQINIDYDRPFAANYQATPEMMTAGDQPIAVHYPTHSQRIQYDPRGRPQTITQTPKAGYNQAAGLIQPDTASRTHIQYDKAGNRTQVTDANGHVTQYQYDAHNRLIHITDAQGQHTQLAYDPHHNLVAVMDANGNQHRMRYDPKHQKIEETRPLGERWQWAYDQVGNLATQTDPKGNPTQHRYDAANRLIQTQLGQKTITFSYNEAGALTQVQDGAIQIDIEVDELNRKIKETTHYGAFSHSQATSYSPTGTKASYTYPDGTQVSYKHNAARQLTQIELPGHGFMGQLRTEDDTKIRTYWAGGRYQIHQLDALQRVGRIDVYTNTHNTLMQHTYRYDPAGNLMQAHYQDQGQNTYQYDKLNRLIEAAYANGSKDQYSYDPVHNRTEDNGQTWTYNGNNQLTAQGQQTQWTYDANGQAIERRGAQTRAYIYNAENRLAEVKDDGQTMAKYQYDPFGRRIKKEVINNNQSKTTWYLYADEGLIAETDEQGHIQVQYGWHPDGLWGTDPLYRLDKDQNTQKNVLYAYHNDQLGTPQLMTDRHNQVVWRQTQRAFGQMAIDPSSTIENNLRFAGQYFDQETGAHYNYFRDYDPTLGRYLQQDPIGLGAGVNVYGYVDGRPKNLIDPLGLQAYMCRNAGIEAWCNNEPMEMCCEEIDECFTPSDQVEMGVDCAMCARTRGLHIVACRKCGAGGVKGGVCLVVKCRKVPKGTCHKKTPETKKQVPPVSMTLPGKPDFLPIEPIPSPEVCYGS